MVHKDYLMRMIEQLSVVLMKIFFNKEVKNYAQAFFEIDAAYRNLLNSEPDRFRKMSETEIIKMLRADSSTYSERILIIAELLREEAEIRELETGFNDTIFGIFLKSFSLYVEAMLAEREYRKEAYFEKTERIVKKILDYELPAPVKFRLFQYYEFTGSFDKAEDVLFELLAVEYADILDESAAFYRRLMEKPDAELLHGNLPRDEVQEGLNIIEAKKKDYI